MHYASLLDVPYKYMHFVVTKKMKLDLSPWYIMFILLCLKIKAVKETWKIFLAL